MKSAEEKALTCVNNTTGNTIMADINTLFFSSTTNKKDSEEDDAEEGDK